MTCPYLYRYFPFQIKWKMNDLSRTEASPDFDSWQLYSENDKGEKTTSDLLPRSSVEYIFNNVALNSTLAIGLCMMNSSSIVACLVKPIESSRQSLGMMKIYLPFRLIKWKMPKN